MKLKIISYFILILFCIFITTCSEKSEVASSYKTDCEKIKDILTDCMGIHKGAFEYVNSCGDISYEEVKSANTCEEVFEIIER